MDATQSTACPTLWAAAREAGTLQLSPALASLVDVMLASQVPMYLVVGDALTLVYNDAYVPVLGAKHPRAFGTPFARVWPEAAAQVLPVFDSVWRGQTVQAKEAPFVIERHGRPEQVWFDFCVSPVHDAAGAVVAGFCVCSERTSDVVSKSIAEERIGFISRTLKDAPCFMAVLKGPQYTYVLSNDAHRALHGRDVVGLTLREVLPGRTGEELLREFDAVLRTGRPSVRRAAPVHFQGRTRVATLAIQPLIEDGVGTGVMIVGVDVTEADEAQRSLALSELRFRAITDALPQLVFVADDHGNTWVNDHYCQYTGCTPEQLTGAGWLAVVHPDDHAAGARAWADAVASGRPYEVRLRMRRADGAWRWMLARATHIAADRGAAREWLGTCTDVHDLQLLEQELATARRRTTAAMVAGNIATVTWDVQRDHVIADENLARLFGVPLDAVRGSPAELFFAAVHPEDLDRLKRDIDATLQGGSLFASAYRVRRADGCHRHIQSHGQLERDAEGRPAWLSAIVVDVSELMQAQEALQLADRRKDEFLAMLAHELRNPLAPIVASAALLPRLKSDSDKVAQIGEVIARQARHLTGLVDDLLDVSRVTRGLVQLEPETLAVNELVVEALEQVQPAAAARHHTVTRTLPAQTAHVHGDRKRLVQVVVNLLGNAVKYTPEGGRITVSAAHEDGQVAVRVADDGIGMSPALCTAAFEMFAQGQRSADRSQGGLGIGLALVKSLVELHGGSVAAHSDGPGRGSTFTLTLPATGQPAQDAPAEQPLAPGKGTVLIVDDNKDAATLLALMLQDAGYRVWVRHRPSEALQLARRLRPQVCLLDIGLPEIDGHVLARRLRELPGMEGSRMAAVSGYAQPADVARSQEAGFERHFAKPIDTRALAGWLAALPPG
jgi:PAS domain S-box-containing protein